MVDCDGRLACSGSVQDATTGGWRVSPMHQFIVASKLDLSSADLIVNK